MNNDYISEKYCNNQAFYKPCLILCSFPVGVGKEYDEQHNPLMALNKEFLKQGSFECAL